jgi:hypothetical protein
MSPTERRPLMDCAGGPAATINYRSVLSSETASIITNPQLSKKTFEEKE